MRSIDQEPRRGKPSTPLPRNLRPELAAAKLRNLAKARPKLALILGTGFEHVAGDVEAEAEVPFSKVPGFALTGVEGHSGRIVIGRLAGTAVLVLSGRVHYYEGCPMEVVTYPVRVLAGYGITDLVLTNSAGGIHRRFCAGDFMILSDHINFMGINPLRGAGSESLSRFVDLSCAYDKGLRELLQKAGRFAGLKVRSGVYLAVCGPSYETPAEIRAFARLGADAVGMSTVPEVVAARQCGLRVAAVSCITNLAAGLSRGPLSHAEVLATATGVHHAAAEMIREFVRMYAEFV